MTVISQITEPRGVAVLWAHVILISQNTEALVFEILESNAIGMENHLHQKQLLQCDKQGVFWGELLSLEYCSSTTPGLALMRDRPTFRGVLKIFPPDVATVQ